MTPPWRRPAWIIVAAALLAAAIATLLNAHSGQELLPYDKGELHIYPLAAARMVRGEEIYRPSDEKPFTYPPAMALPFVPMLALPVYAHRPFWYAANVALLVSIFVLLREILAGLPRTGGGARRTHHGVFWALVLAMSTRHLVSVFENQSHDFLLLLLLMFATRASCRGHEWRTGIHAGVAAAGKATPLLFLPCLAWQRRFRAATAVVIGSAAAVMLPDVIFPRDDGGIWVIAWYKTFVSGVDAVGGTTEQVGNAWSAWNKLNQNLAGTLYRLFTEIPVADRHTWDVSLVHLSRGTLRALTIGAQLAVLALIAWALRPRLAAGEVGAELHRRRLGEAGAIVCGMVLLSPMSSKSHFGVLLLPIAFSVHHYLYRRRDPFLVACFAVLIAGTLTSKGIVGRTVGDGVLARGSVTWCAVAALLAAVRCLAPYRSRLPE